MREPKDYEISHSQITERFYVLTVGPISCDFPHSSRRSVVDDRLLTDGSGPRNTITGHIPSLFGGQKMVSQPNVDVRRQTYTCKLFLTFDAGAKSVREPAVVIWQGRGGWTL